MAEISEGASPRGNHRQVAGTKKGREPRMTTTKKAAPAKSAAAKKQAQDATASAIVDALNGDSAPLEAIVEKVAETKAKAAPKKATAKKAAAPKKEAAAKATAEPKPAPEKKVPTAPAGAKVVEIPTPRPIVLDAVSDALARMPKGSKTSRVDEFVVVHETEAQAAVTAITEHMRAIVAENRSANMYREGKLRGVRTAILGTFKDLSVPSAARTSTGSSKKSSKKSSPEKAKAKANELQTATAERKAFKAWEAEDEATRGPRPETGTYDALAAAYEEKEAVKAKEAEARRQEKAEAASSKTARARKEVTPNLKSQQARKAS